MSIMTVTATATILRAAISSDHRIGHMSNEQRYFDALLVIAKRYQTSDQLRRHSGQYRLGHTEELEMAYENMQQVAKDAIKGQRRPKSP